MFMSAVILYYKANAGLAALIISPGRCWLSWHIFHFAPLRRRCQANCCINCPVSDWSHVVAVWRFPECDARPVCVAFPWTLQCPQQHLELIVTPNHQAFSCDSAGTGGQQGECVVTCFRWLDLWMKWEGMVSDPKHYSETMNGFKLYGRGFVC